MVFPFPWFPGLVPKSCDQHLRPRSAGHRERLPMFRPHGPAGSLTPPPAGNRASRGSYELPRHGLTQRSGRVLMHHIGPRRRLLGALAVTVAAAMAITSCASPDNGGAASSGATTAPQSAAQSADDTSAA